MHWEGEPGDGIGVAFDIKGDFEANNLIHLLTMERERHVLFWPGGVMQVRRPELCIYIARGGAGTDHLEVLRDGDLINVIVNDDSGDWCTEARLARPRERHVGLIALAHQGQSRADASFDSVSVIYR